VPLPDGGWLADPGYGSPLREVVSTLFTAQNVRDRLASDPGLVAALDWCKPTAVTRVFLECFRDGYQAARSTLPNAMVRFRAEGLEVSGCVTPTPVGKRSTGGNVISLSVLLRQPPERDRATKR
jgi:hypothetical protein